MKKIISFIKKYISFSSNFVHPEITNVVTPDISKVKEDLQKEINTKIEKVKAEKMDKIKPHLKVLNDYLVTYFQTKYTTDLEIQTAYNLLNKKWIAYIKDVNSRSRTVTHLNKDTFKNEVIRVIKTIKKNKENATNNNK